MPAIKKHFSYKFNNKIWKTEYVQKLNWLIIECLNETNQISSFSAIDLDKKKIIWTEKSLTKSNDMTLSGSLSHYVLLKSVIHNLENNSPKEIVAINLLTNQTHWEENNFIIYDIKHNQLSGYKLKNNIKTLQKIDFIDESNTDSLSEPSKSGNKSIKLPFRYKEQTNYFAQIRNFLNVQLGILIEKVVDYIELEKFVIISYYICTKRMLSNYLLVLDLYGNQIIHEVLEQSVDGVGACSFFMINKDIVFIKEKKEIHIYEI